MTYNWADMERQLTDWRNAAEALSGGDASGIVAALAHHGDERGAEVIYREVTAMAALGAHLTAGQIIRVNGGAACSSFTGQKYALYARVPDPSIEPSANERVATHAVLAASRGDLGAVVDLVMGYSGHPDGAGLQRLADLTMTLLRMYVCYSGIETPT